MSIMVAIQSCIYYYAACSPCNKCLNRRKRRQEAVREKKLKAEIEDQQPGLYRHPSPFSTNMYWREEMLLGPGPPHRKKRDNNRTNSQRTLTTGDQGSSVASSGIGSADGPASDMEQEHRFSGDGWNRRRYQREDEELWGHEEMSPTNKLRGAFLWASSSVGLTGVSRSAMGTSSSTGTISKGDYYTPRNPPVNDLHPPIVSTPPTHKAATRWMLQPPPSAKVMEGKVRAKTNRSRSDSGASSRRGRDTSLGRRIGERCLEEKRRKGDYPEVELSNLAFTEVEGRKGQLAEE